VHVLETVNGEIERALHRRGTTLPEP
jgi:hypothetical protein